MTTRNTCFTLNNPTKNETKQLLDCKYTYMIIGYEKGEKGTPHLQGYVEWGRSVRWETLKKLNERIHWESRKGSPSQAAEYCKKDGKFIEKGVISEQGKRSDILNCTEMINNGDTIRDIAIANPVTYVKYHKGLNAYKYAITSHRTAKPKVHWRWGKAGVGKTKYCVETHPSHYIKDGTPWWDGYENQEAIIVDDFDGGWPFRDFLRMLDRYAYQGQIKGGYVKVNSPYIYITCEHPPERYWGDNELAQVLRRLDSVAEVGGNTRPQLLQQT